MAVFHDPPDLADNEDDSGRTTLRHRPGPGGVTWADFLRYVRRNRGRLLGLAIGLAVGFGVRYLGFLWTFFISACAAVGYFIGLRFDDNREGFLEFLDRILPPGRG